MEIAVLRESKKDAQGREVENRVVLTPPLLATLKKDAPGAKILVEAGAGEKIGYSNGDYLKAGALKIVPHDEALRADLVVGVKETKTEDFPKLNKNIFFSYQHFAESKERTEAARNSGATFVCFETMEKEVGGKITFPCLAPMSEAAARVVVRHADWFALHSKRTIGCGLSQTGMKNLRVTIVGAGTVGRTAAKEFSARGYEVHMLDRPNLHKLPSSIKGSFFVVSSMYSAGRCPEKMVTKALLNEMAPGGCAYPVDIDQGGGIEGVFVTSVLEPFDLKKIEGTEIFCFAPPNLPSLGARTTSDALGSAVLPYIIEIANRGLAEASKNPTIRTGINIQNGELIHPGIK
jgi:alanine dehydrogenase